MSIALLALASGLLIWFSAEEDPNGQTFPPGTSSPGPEVGRSSGEVASPVPTLDELDRQSLHCTVRVTSRAGKPVLGCSVLGWVDASSGLLEGTTDDSGFVRWPERDAVGGAVAIGSNGSFGILHPIPWRGEHLLVVEDGGVLSASVLVDGITAPAGLEFGLRATDLGLTDALPAAVKEALQKVVGWRTTTTDAQGGFAFAGLHEAFRGRLVLPPTHWMEDVTDSIGPPRFLENQGIGHRVLHVVRLPTVRGTVYWDDGKPASGGAVAVVGTFAGGLAGSGQTSIGSDGSFELGLEPARGDQRGRWLNPAERPQFLSGVLTVHELPTVPANPEVMLRASSLASPVEIVIRRALTQHALIRDEIARPIVGAQLDCKDSPPTDENGRTTFYGDAPRCVGGVGRTIVAANPVGGDGTEPFPFEYVLPAQNRLVLQVMGPADAVLDQHEFVIETPAATLASASYWLANHAPFGGSEVRSVARQIVPEAESPTIKLHLLTDRRGRAVVHSLTPGSQGRALLLDAMGVELTTVGIVAPNFGEENLVELHLPTTLVTLRGRVERADGSPLPHAELGLSGPQRQATVRTAADGRFRFLLARSHQPTDLRVRAPGWVAVTRPDVARGDGDLGVIRLQMGRTVTVRVVDETGAPVDLFAKPVGFEHVQQQTLGVGVWRWPDMPSEVVFYATVSGRRFESFAGPSVDEVVLTTTRVARVWAPQADLPADAGVRSNEACVLLTRQDATNAVPETLHFSVADSNSLRVLPGLYRAELARWHRTADGTVQVEPLGITKTLDLHAGEPTAVRF